MSRPLRWAPGFRIIRTIYPPVDLFEDIADPADWELLVSAEAKLNPRIRDEIGNLAGPVAANPARLPCPLWEHQEWGDAGQRLQLGGSTITFTGRI